MDDIKEGATVQLKSGGPIMTVIYLTAGMYAPEDAEKNKAHCQWFSTGSAKPNSETFPIAALKLVDVT